MENEFKIKAKIYFKTSTEYYVLGSKLSMKYKK